MSPPGHDTPHGVRRKKMETIPLESFMDERVHERPSDSGNGHAQSHHPATHLLSGIVHDAQRFMSAYGELLKHDVRSELAQTRKVAIVAALGAAGAGAAVLVLCLAVAHGASLAFGWSLAVSYAAVGGVVLLLAAVFLVAAHRSAARLSPPHALLEAKEDVEWIRSQT